MMKAIYFYSTILCLSLLMIVFANLDFAYAEGPNQEKAPHGFMKQLNDTQKAEIDSMVTHMKADGASRKEIREAVREKLDTFGVKPHKRRGPREGGPWFEDQLNKEQRKAVRAKIESLWEEGASREEIHEAVSEMLKEYGVEPPEGRFDGPPREGRFEGPPHQGRFDRPPRGRRHGMRFPGMDLNKEQREAIRDKVDAMRDEGAGREEIHEAVSEMLKEYGIEPPEDGGRYWALMQDLNKEQRKEVRQTVRQMREEGASRKEIREAVDELLEKYGVEKSQPVK